MRGEDNSRCPLDGWHALGLMSGTSVDGLDVASVQFFQDAQTKAWSFTMNAFMTLPYPEALRGQLWHAMTFGAEDLMRLDTAWAQWTGKKIETWMKSAGVPPPHVVGSHGHTVFHRPDEGWTCQIGHGAVLHALLGVPVVSDLRSLDVAMGGQGAPLVPLADQMLFGDWDVALNLGGFANLSMDNATGTRVAWDVGPANLLLNRVVQTVGLDMDRDGAMAAEGSVLPHLLETWQSLSFHSQAAPKSLGREWLEKEVWPHAEHALQGHALNDVLATAVAYASWAVTRDVPSGSRILVTGGGACNPTLMAAMRQATLDRDVTWHVPEDAWVHGKEALVFAWLGLLRWLGQPNALPSVTGARVATSGGALWGSGPRGN